MFSNLDNFLNGDDNFAKQQMKDLEDTPISNENDSFDLDLSMPSLTKSKSKSKSKTKSKSKAKGADDDEDEDELDKGVSFVPSKGQKMAAKRLQKISETLTNKMVETERLQSQMERKASKSSKRKSPKKPTGRRTGRARRAPAMDLDSDLTSSDSEGAACLPGRAQNRPRPVYDPNLIVLDCDDEFIGGPAVNFTRNVAAASAVSVEESMELKVNVRIKGEINHFHMSPYQKLSALITQISEKHNVPSDHIALMFKDKTVTNEETPKSIGYIQGLVIKAHISDMLNKNKASSTANANADKLEIKIQAEGRKRPFVIYIGKNDELITLAFACAEEFKCDVDKVALEFDGDFINFKETAEELGLDGGEIMDFFMKK